MANSRQIAVTGASGFIGRHLVTRLIEDGDGVRALVRDPAKARKVLPESDRLELVVGDVLDSQACSAAVAGADACIHLIGILREHGRSTFERMHVAAVAQMVRACEAAGVTRFVHMSALGASPLGRAAYERSKFEGEQVVRGSGLEWTIFRPSLVHGAEGELMELAAGWARGRIPPHIFMPYFSRIERGESGRRRVAPRVQPIYVDDLVEAIIRSLDSEAAKGEIYPIAGSEVVDWPDLLSSVRDAIPNVGPRLAPLGISGEFAASQARLAAKIGLGGLLPFDEGMALMGASDSTAELDKARADLDFHPAGFHQALAQYADQL